MPLYLLKGCLHPSNTGTAEAKSNWETFTLNHNQTCLGINVWSHLLDMPSDSILKLEMSSVALPSSSAPTPRPRGPMADSRRRAWISSEMVSRLRRAVRYSALAWVSLAWRSSTRRFSCCMGGQGEAENRSQTIIINIRSNLHASLCF